MKELSVEDGSRQLSHNLTNGRGVCIMYHLKIIQLDRAGTEAAFLVAENDRDFWTDWLKKNLRSITMKTTHDNESWKSLEEYETPKTRAFENALDISIAIIEKMKAKGLSQKELAEKMKITPAALSQMLNTQPNMTLLTLAKFELALDLDFFKHIRTEKTNTGVDMKEDRSLKDSSQPSVRLGHLGKLQKALTGQAS